MVVWNLFFSSVLLPLVAIALLGRHPRRPVSSWLATLLLASGLTGFAVLASPWGWFGLPLRWAILVLFIVAVLVSLRRRSEVLPEGMAPLESASASPIRLFLKVIIGLFFGNVAIGVLSARNTPPGAVDLGMPLRSGTYLVFHGGSTPAANSHPRSPVEQYAVDFVKLNAAGMRARGIYPNGASKYAIFGEPVVSPCDGTVLATEGGRPDAARISIDEQHPLGNRVILRCGDVDVTLAHLQRGSVSVQPKAQVARGAAIARAGNSGTTGEPHLHLHAERAGAAVPLKIDGRWLVRNDTVKGKP